MEDPAFVADLVSQGVLDPPHNRRITPILRVISRRPRKMGFASNTHLAHGINLHACAVIRNSYVVDSGLMVD